MVFVTNCEDEVLSIIVGFDGVVEHDAPKPVQHVTRRLVLPDAGDMLLMPVRTHDIASPLRRPPWAWED